VPSGLTSWTTGLSLTLNSPATISKRKRPNRRKDAEAPCNPSTKTFSTWAKRVRMRTSKPRPLREWTRLSQAFWLRRKKRQAKPSTFLPRTWASSTATQKREQYAKIPMLPKRKSKTARSASRAQRDRLLPRRRKLIWLLAISSQWWIPCLRSNRQNKQQRKETFSPKRRGLSRSEMECSKPY